MHESIFGEFQYFIRRINGFRAGSPLAQGETIEDLELRFRVQVENGMVINDPDSQEIAMEILLSDLTELEKRRHLMELRKTGRTSFKAKKVGPKVLKLASNETIHDKREKALDLIVRSLQKVGVKARRQPLGVKMLYAEHELKTVDYDDIRDLKLLLVNTVRISGHAKKVSPEKLANVFNEMTARYA